MGVLSSNTLFHYTNKMDYLIKILENDFSPRISIENLSTDITNEIGIPMVSFCDIPLSQVSNHSMTYGKYGIGLTKEWGQRMGITPVMYFHNSANHFKPFNIATDKLKSDIYGIEPQYSFEMYSHIMYITWFHKLYEGLMWKDNKYMEKKFYDEREWRYIPSLGSMYDSGITKMSYFDEDVKKLKHDIDFKEMINIELGKEFKLKFTPNDIKYLIVDKETEILKMISRVKKLKHKYGEDEIHLLITRIVSMESIENDF